MSKTGPMETGPEAPVIKLPIRPTPEEEVGAPPELVALHAQLGTTLNELRNLSLQLGRTLQFGHLNHVSDPFELSYDVAYLIDEAARAIVQAGTQLGAAANRYDRTAWWKPDHK